MVLAWYDWVIIAAFLIASLAIGFALRRRAGRDSGSFFLSGRNVPWWLLGVSMVATTFSTDTPNLVTEIVRTRGVAGNWVWWAFLITGMFTCFLYARLWRRSGVFTDLEFYELRYSGRPAAAVRAFRAVYLGVFFNVVVIALVTLAAIKIGAVALGASPLQTVLVAGAVTVAFSALGGFLGVVITDLILFAVSMAGAVAAAWVAVNLPEVGGLANLLESPEVAPRLSFFPDLSNMELAVTLLVIRSPCSGGVSGTRDRSRAAAATWRNACWPPGASGTRRARCSCFRPRTTLSGPGRGSWSRWRRWWCSRISMPSGRRFHISRPASSATILPTRPC